MSSATGYQLDVNLVPYINSFNILPEEPFSNTGPTGPNSSFRYNTIFIDIKDKKIISDIDIYTNNINGEQLRKKVYTSTSTIRISDEFDEIFNIEHFKTYVFEKFGVSNVAGQVPYSGVNKPSNQQNPYSIENYINKIEFTNVSIDLQTAKSAVSMPLQIRFDTTTYHHIPEHETDSCAMPERNNITSSSKNVAPFVYQSQVGELTIFDLRLYALTAQKYAMQKFNRFKYIFDYNPFQYPIRPAPVPVSFKYVIFPSNGTYYFTENIVEFHYILVGGGGAGGRAGVFKEGKTPKQGGGAGGDVRTGLFAGPINPNSLLSVTIGLGAEQGTDATYKRKGASGNASSFIITDQNGNQLLKETAVGGEGGAGGDGGGAGNTHGKGGGIGTALRGKGGDYSSTLGFVTINQAVKQDVTFNDGGGFTMSIASGGGGGGYISNLDPGPRTLFKTPPSSLNGGYPQDTMLGGLGVEDSNDYNPTQNGQNIRLGTFASADYPNGVPSGSGGAGGGFAGGSGSNGIAIFYFR